MQRLILRVTALIPLLIALSILSVFIGRQQPPSQAITLLHLNDCKLPCWIGITPGKTTLAEGRARVREIFGHSPTYSLVEYPYNFAIDRRSDDFSNSPFYVKFDTVEGSIDTAVIQAIILSAEAEALYAQPSIGELTELLGNPTYITPFLEESNVTELIFDGRQTDIEILKPHCNAIMPEQKVLTIIIYTRNYDISNWPKWRGFKTCYTPF